MYLWKKILYFWYKYYNIDRVCKKFYIRGIKRAYIPVRYNICSDNYQIKELAQIVKEEIEKAYTDKQIIINSLNIQDVRNYKVSLEKAKNNLRFNPQYDVKNIIEDLINNYNNFSDFDNDVYYNINTFKNIV